jgi:hypothetical protein
MTVAAVDTTVIIHLFAGMPALAYWFCFTAAGRHTDYVAGSDVWSRHAEAKSCHPVKCNLTLPYEAR